MKSFPIRIYFIECILLIFFAVGFLNMSSYWLLLFFGVVVVFDAKFKNMFLCEDLVALFFCFFSFYFLYVAYYEKGLELYILVTLFIGPIMGFLAGQLMVNGNNVKLRNCILLVSSCTLLHGVLNLLQAKTAKIWFDQSIVDFWTGENVSATLNGAYFTGAIVLFFWFISKTGILSKLLGTGILGLIIWSSVTTAERTLVINFILCAFIYVYGKAFLEKKNKNVIKRLIKYTAIILLIGIVLAVLYVNDVFEIQTMFLQTSLGERLTMLDSITQDGRGNAMLDVLNALQIHPMGNLRDMFYAHNLIVDIGRLCGVIPMMLMLIYILIILKTAVKVYKNEAVDSNIRLIILMFYFAFLVNFMVEPVLEGLPMIFISFCIVNGGVKSVSCKYRILEK